MHPEDVGGVFGHNGLVALGTSDGEGVSVFGLFRVVENGRVCFYSPMTWGERGHGEGEDGGFGFAMEQCR